MTYRDGMEYTVRWSDGFAWRADQATFARVTQSLLAARESIVGLAPVLARWSLLAARGNELPVDAYALNEADRAVFTAGVARALDDTAALPPDDRGATVERLGALHELFVTDVTR